MSRELPAVRPLHHHVELNLTKFLAGVSGGPHAGDHSAGSGAMTDQLELAVGDQPLADQHPVELGTDGHHVFGGGQAFVGFGGDRVDRRDFVVGK